MEKLIFKLFGGKAKSLIASGAVSLALFLLAQLAKLDPHLAAMINPDLLAAWLSAAAFSGINALTNKTHIAALEDLNAAINSGPQPDASIPVEPAKPV